MFLYNILLGNSNKQQTQKCDKIQFKINLADNIPQFHQVLNAKYQQQQQLTANHPMYKKIFGKQKQSVKNQTKSDNKLLINRNQRDEFSQIQASQSTPLKTQLQQSSQTKPSERSHYKTYLTTQNDTIFGLALRLNISQKQICDLNNLSMIIKLPIGVDLSLLKDDIKDQTTNKVRISQILLKDNLLDDHKIIKRNSLINQSKTHNQLQKCQVDYFSGTAGYIKGMLTINKNYLIFNPNLQCKQNLSKFSVEKLLKFNAIVETLDIQDITYLSLPQIDNQQDNTDDPRINHLLQVYLYTVGNPKIQKKYQQRLTKLKSQKKAIAFITFRLKQQQKAQQVCKKIQKKVHQIISQIQQEQQVSVQSHQSLSKSEGLSFTKGQLKPITRRLTNLPYFQIMHQNLHPRLKQQMQSISQQQSLLTSKPTTPLGMLNQSSDIINDMMFTNLAGSLPMLYQQANWDRIYSSTVNGTSFLTFLNKAKDQYPLILLVKEYKGERFGAFLVDSLETGKTGRGEMFLFTFKNSTSNNQLPNTQSNNQSNNQLGSQSNNQVNAQQMNCIPTVYKWTTKNEFFVYIQKDSGIGIGMGVKYGLFLRNTLDKGSSAPTITFGNTQSLSKKEDFIIEEVQLWTIDMSY